MTGKAGQVSNGLKSIGANIVKMANTAGVLEFQANKTAKSIDLIDESTGDLKSTYQVLYEVSEAWDSMSKSEQTALALDLAGKTQVSVFASIMGNFGDAIEANAVSMDSYGSAMEENSKRADSLEARFASLRREVEEMVLGDGGFNAFIKGVVSLTAGIVKFMNATNGLPVLLTDIGVIFALVLIPKAKALAKEYTELAVKAIAATKSSGSLSIGLKEVGITASATQLAIGALTAVISIAVMAFSAMEASNERRKAQAEQNISRLDDEAKSIKKVIDILKDENLKRDELISAINSTNSKYKEELGAIEDVNELREKGIELLEKERKEKAEAARAAMFADAVEAKQKLSSSSKFQTNLGTEYLGTPTSTGARGVATYEYENLEKMNQALKDATEAVAKKVEAGEEELYVLQAIQALYNKSSEDLAKFTETSEKFDELTREITGDIDENGNAVEKTSNAYEDWFNDMQEGQVEALAKALKMSTEEFYGNAAAMGLSLKEYSTFIQRSNDISDVMDKTNSSIDGLQSALGTAQEAMKQYNETGLLNVDTFQELMAISPEYLSALVNENGQLTVNQETLGDLIEQLKIAKIEELQNAAAADILALAHGNVDEMSSTARKAIADLGGDIVESGNKASTASGQMLGFAGSVMAVVNAKKGLASGELPDDFEAKQQAILDAYTKMGNKITSIAVDTTNNVAKASKTGAKGAKKAAKDTTDAYKEAYQKQLDDLDHRLAMGEISEKEYYKALEDLNERYFGVASGQHEKYLSEYQKNQEKIYKWQKKQEEELLKAQKQTYDKALDYIKSNLQKKADMLKKSKDSELKDIDDDIKYFEKRRDRELKGIGDRIDALKEEKKVFVDGISEQVDSLTKLRDAEKEQWDEKISAFKEQNKLLKEQTDLQKLQEALALAKSRRVNILKDGKFQYGEDESAVSGAEQAIDDYYTDLKQQKELEALENARDAALNYYQEQIDSLKDYKDKMSNQYDEEIDRLEKHRDDIQEYYDNRIEDMKEHREEVEEEYDAQIEIMENYIDNFQGMIDSYDEEQNRLALIQLKGAESEKDVWMMRLENLRDFVNEYNRLKDELDNGSTDNEVRSSNRSVRSTNIMPGRASGDASIQKDGMYEVGEDPNREIIIGSKMNGEVANLSKGDGVVNAKSTKTLAGILNSLPSSFNLGSFKEKEGSDGTVNSLSIDKVYVQADDSMKFMDSMAREFKIAMKQDVFAPART